MSRCPGHPGDHPQRRAPANPGSLAASTSMEPRSRARCRPRRGAAYQRAPGVRGRRPDVHRAGLSLLHTTTSSRRSQWKCSQAHFYFDVMSRRPGGPGTLPHALAQPPPSCAVKDVWCAQQQTAGVTVCDFREHTTTHSPPPPAACAEGSCQQPRPPRGATQSRSRA